MQREFSIYLDALRFFAAILVFLTHANFIGYKSVLFTAGHEAVMIFFVLSGYVIAYVADSKEKTIKDYSLSRIARIYSVALPAILLAVILDEIGLQINDIGYPEEFDASDYKMVRFVSSFLFTNELWFTSIQSFSNHPYWSLNYEVWYYISFACLTYFQGLKKWLLITAVILIAGIKIILLAPIWWAGVWCYRSNIHNKITMAGGWGFFIASCIGIFIYFFFNLEGITLSLLRDILSVELYTDLAFSKRFLTDYYLTICVLAHFIGVRKIAPTLKGILKFERPIRWIACYTFALYLYHVPLLYFFRSVFNTTATTPNDLLLVSFSTLITIFILGTYTERQKGPIKKHATSIYNYIANFTQKKS